MPDRVGTPDEIVICRCEEVTEADIHQAYAEGYRTVEDLKRLLRIGMGPCGGRTCMPLLLGMVARLAGVPVAQVAPAVSRPPLKPLELARYAALQEQQP